MLSIKVYNWDKIERWPIWYIIFTTIVVFLVIYSFLKGGMMGWISVLFIFLVIAVSYVIVYLMSMKKTEIKLYDWFFLVWDKKYNFDDLLWFNIELDDNWNFTNFVIVPRNTSYPLKYRIISSFDEVKEFYKALMEMWLPLNWEYENDRIYKLIKFLKLG